MRRNTVLGLVMSVALVSLLLPSCKSISPEELKASVGIVELSSTWVAKTNKDITQKNNYEQEGNSLAQFKHNPQWKPMICKLFVQSKGSVHVLLGEYEISREIDFKEPEPVATGKQ